MRHKGRKCETTFSKYHSRVYTVLGSSIQLQLDIIYNYELMTLVIGRYQFLLA